jgi:hypothetical protein
MLCPFRPFLENLEKREVFSAGPLAGALAAQEPVAWSIGNLPGTQPVAFHWGVSNTVLLGRGNDGDQVVGNGFQSQPSVVDHTPDHEPDVLHLAAPSRAASHDAVFTQTGRASGGLLGLEREHPSVLIGLLIP